ncbi:MAG: thiolase family protein [Akkermansiaceae bacterium]|nr:thiolase family protein [Akkermansiaceae bacterium]
MQILAATRTPFSKMGTELAPLTAADLGRHALVSLLAETGVDPGEISEVIVGCVGQPPDSANVARIIALRAGIPDHVPAVTVHRNCASGMEAITTAAERIAAGQGDLFVVGGVESMTRIPFFYRDSAVRKFGALARSKSLGQKLGAISKFRPRDFSPIIGLKLGLTDPYSGLNMGETAEVLAREFGISREQQDAFAAESHRKALAAREDLDAEISPVPVNGHAAKSDNGLREDSTPERLAKLRPVFDRRNGTVTAGNSSQITDGAVMLLVATDEKARALGIPALGELTGWAYTGCDPKRMGLGPVKAIEALLKRTGKSLSDADLIEINEAFAAQVLAVEKALSDPEAAARAGLDAPLGTVPRDKLNRWGGSIALGHPVGATGARLVFTALHQLRKTRGRQALAALCVGGGQGAALWLEAPPN